MALSTSERRTLLARLPKPRGGSSTMSRFGGRAEPAGAANRPYRPPVGLNIGGNEPGPEFVPAVSGEYRAAQFPAASASGVSPAGSGYVPYTAESQPTGYGVRGGGYSPWWARGATGFTRGPEGEYLPRGVAIAEAPAPPAETFDIGTPPEYVAPAMEPRYVGMEPAYNWQGGLTPQELGRLYEMIARMIANPQPSPKRGYYGGQGAGYYGPTEFNPGPQIEMAGGEVEWDPMTGRFVPKRPRLQMGYQELSKGPATSFHLGGFG